MLPWSFATISHIANIWTPYKIEILKVCNKVQMWCFRGVLLDGDHWANNWSKQCEVEIWLRLKEPQCIWLEAASVQTWIVKPNDTILNITGDVLQTCHSLPFHLRSPALLRLSVSNISVNCLLAYYCDILQTCCSLAYHHQPSFW